MAPRRPNVRPWAIAGALVVIAGIVVAIVSGGGSGASNSSSGRDTRPIVAVTHTNALNTANVLRNAVDEQNLSDFEDLFQGDFHETVDLPTCTGVQQPWGADEALGEWQCIFDAGGKLQLGMTNVSFDRSADELTAGYVLTTGGHALAAGQVRLHLIPGPDFPRIDRLAFTGGRGSFKP